MGAMRPLRIVMPIAAVALLSAEDGKPPDPYAGMDRSGRIPVREWPIALPNQERWRYVPEGRIQPGNALQRLFVSSFIAPVFYYEEAVGGGGGIALTDIDFREQRRQEFLGLFASRSTKGQEGYSVIWQRWLEHHDLAGGGMVQEERSLVRVRAGYTRSLTRRYYGRGPDTRPGDETSYTDEVASVAATVQKSLPGPGDAWVARLGLRGEHHNLASGQVRSVPSSEERFAGEVVRADGVDALWTTTRLSYDTRDSQANPYRGWLVQIDLDAMPRAMDGDPGGIGRLEATWTTPLPGLFHDGGAAERARLGPEENPPTDVLAVGAFVTRAWGDLPFYDLPSLGGADTLRGYIADRFTGTAAWHASAEWRIVAIARGAALTDSVRIERFGIAPFIDVGTVAGSLDRLPRSRHHWNAGLGLRLGLERTAQFRLDLARSSERFAVNLAFGMAF
jgi:hypothetical protein